MRSVPNQASSSTSFPPGVADFIAEHAVACWPAPFGQCPECNRTLTAVAVYTNPEWDHVVWHFKCPVHRDLDFALDGKTMSP